MINYTRAFDSAWERMMVILFRPFDLGKWFAIGFSAFLAGLEGGGNGVTGWFNRKSFDRSNWSFSYNTNAHQLSSSVSSLMAFFQHGFSLMVVGLILIPIFGLIVFFLWLGARGQFLLLDNVARNRAAIAWPWSVYERQGNSLFLFYFGFLLIMLAIFIPLNLAGVFSVMPLSGQHGWHSRNLPLEILLGLTNSILGLAFYTVLFLFRELGVPLMFRNGLLARAAFGEMWQLVRLHPGSIILFLILRIALFLALAVLSMLACCCFCLGAIPYIGTVVLLPAILYIKCFTLDFLAQFGPEYDVWNVDVAPAVAPIAAVGPPPEPNLPPPPL